MHSSTRRFTGIAAAWLLCCGAAQAQSLEQMQVQYANGRPEVVLGGTSGYYWDEIASTVTVSGRSISIVLQIPDFGFSVMWFWSVVVPLPPLTEEGGYDVSVALGSKDGTISEPIGTMRSWLRTTRPPDRIFRSQFETSRSAGPLDLVDTP